MRLSGVLVAVCAIACAHPAVAQSGDPISGTWSGYMGPNETNRNAITVELKFDGKSAVSGTITGPTLTPGKTRSGSYDPKTGALKLEVAVEGQATVANFEGTVVQGTASGRVFFPTQTGIFSITKNGTGATASSQPAAKPAPAKPSAADEATGHARRSFTEVSGWIARAVELVPADKYTYKPAQSVRTFGQLIAHIADGYAYYCGRAVGRSVQWSDATEKGNTTKATLGPKLKQALDTCNAAYAGGQIGALIENVGHTNLHYGNIVTYIRMLGLTPPSS